MTSQSLLKIAARLTLGAAISFTRTSAVAQDEGTRTPPSQPSPEQVELIAAHNQERAVAKLAPLVANPKLMTAALIQARDMAEHDTMSHEGSDGSKPHERIERQGYHGRRTGENVAGGQGTVPQVMRAWMSSPHHRENILGEFSEIGVARVNSKDGTPYWCVNFGLSWPRIDRDEAASRLVAALNRARAQAERPALKPNAKLGEAAQKMAEDLAAAGDLDAGRIGGEPTPDKRVQQTGYHFLRLGESAAIGQAAAEDVVKTWFDSPASRENFLGKFSEVGVGYAQSEKGIPFWCVFLAEPAPR